MALATSQNKYQTLFNNSEKSAVNSRVFGKKVGLVTKLFGCWHENLSRPFGSTESAYRACLNCGARKQFDTQTLQTHGAFYFPPVREERV